MTCNKGFLYMTLHRDTNKNKDTIGAKSLKNFSPNTVKAQAKRRRSVHLLSMWMTDSSVCVPPSNKTTETDFVVLSGGLPSSTSTTHALNADASIVLEIFIVVTFGNPSFSNRPVVRLR